MYSPRIIRDMITVKMGAELFTVSAKDTATFFRLTSPKTTVANLKTSKKYHKNKPICMQDRGSKQSALTIRHAI